MQACFDYIIIASDFEIRPFSSSRYEIPYIFWSVNVSLYHPYPLNAFSQTSGRRKSISRDIRIKGNLHIWTSITCNFTYTHDVNFE